MGAFPISFTGTDLWHRLTDSVQTLFMAICKFSLDSLLDGLTKKNVEVVEIKFNFKFQKNR